MTTPDLSKRRRFQPPITTFFPTDQSTSTHSLSHNHYSAPTYSPTPVVSAKVQSNLLSAGARIRKAVPEGYRTQPKQPPPTPTPTPLSTGSHNIQYPIGTKTELTPFCGMSKSGDPVAVTDDGDAFSLPASSQESTASVSTTLKRGFGFEEEGEPIIQNGFLPDDNVAPAQTGRTILNPSLGRQRRLLVEGNENAGRRTLMEVDDFEEADFLHSREEVDREDLALIG